MWRHTLWKTTALAFLAFSLAGCGWLTDPDPVLGHVTDVTAPDTVAVGQLFTVTVTTTGPNGCWRSESTEVEVDGLSAVITPYDVDEAEANPGIACTQAIVYFDHEAELRFDSPGTAGIDVQGRDGTDRQLDVVVEP